MKMKMKIIFYKCLTLMNERKKNTHLCKEISSK